MSDGARGLSRSVNPAPEAAGGSDILPGTLRGRRLKRVAARVGEQPLVQSFGTVVDIQGPLARVSAPNFQVGDICEFLLRGGQPLLGEVIGLQNRLTLITPLGPIQGIGQGTLVRRRGPTLEMDFSDALMGQVVSGLGEVIGPKPEGARWQPLPIRNFSPPPMDRALIDTAMATGIRAIDGPMTLARGQRIAIIGPPGVGKSSLLAGIASNCEADVVVFGLIGERGREISDFISRKIPDSTRRRLVVVAAPADRPALERIHAANTATAIAEGFRNQGKSVLLILDSLTRVARAIREVGLAAGEPPTRRGYPASVFARLPELIERPGRAKRGEITAIYSVLAEGDPTNDPIAEETRSLVDGHIILDAKAFASGRFPPIDVGQSLSRVMGDVVSDRHFEMASEMRAVLARYAEVELLLQIGEYRRGQDAQTDRALDLYPKITDFLKQSDMKATPLRETLTRMEEIFA